MSSPLEHSNSLAARLGAMAQRLGLGGGNSKRILERARQLALPFRPLPQPSTSIWWLAGPPLHRLPELPRDALSGPVQEDKAEAHAMLVRIVEQHIQRSSAFDLRAIDGLLGSEGCSLQHESLEQFSADPLCRDVRIISYKDFTRVLDCALPQRDAEHPLQLRQASWRGERIFWAGEQHSAELACAVVYARRRGLEIQLPAQVSRYRLSRVGIAELERSFHALAMPVQAWTDPAFMDLLLDRHLPYSRLSLLRTPEAPEFLILPKRHPAASALGQGLRLAGAPELADTLRLLLP